MNTLEISQLSHAFGGLQAISDFNLRLQSSETVGIIGPNGAGKTTLFNLLCGVYQSSSGDIWLNQQRLNQLGIDQIARLGIARTFQNIRLFKALTVIDNVKIAIQQTYGFFAAMSRLPRFKQQEALLTQQAYDWLARLNLTAYAQMAAVHLPYGLQRRLEIARALATQPCILLLDEPACGMNHQEALELSELIRDIQQEYHLAIILIDHQMHFVKQLCPQLLVLNFGKTIARGDPASVCCNPLVIESYLGAMLDENR